MGGDPRLDPYAVETKRPTPGWIIHLASWLFILGMLVVFGTISVSMIAVMVRAVRWAAE